MARRVIEISTTGVDGILQGISSTPYPSRGTPTTIGLRIPPKQIDATTRYLFCLATCSLTSSGRIRGLRQGLKIGLDTNNTSFTNPTAQERVIESWVTTRDFRFSDGNVSWHLVKEPEGSPTGTVPATSNANLAYLRSDAPALLYQTYTATGPLYYQGITAYTPPDLTGAWQGIGGLGTMFDIRFPWANPLAWDSLDIPVSRGRYSFYASVLQTNPNTRANAVYQPQTTTAEGNANLGLGTAIPEEAFISNWVAHAEAQTGTGVVFWRVMGSMIVETED